MPSCSCISPAANGRRTRAHGLEDAELARLRALDTRRVCVYAGTLDRKRVDEATRAFPISLGVGGDGFRQALLDYVRSTPLPATSQRYRDDAVGFARVVRRRGRSSNATLGEELALFEAETMNVWARRLPLGWRRFRYPVADTARDPHAAVAAAPTLVVWSGYPVRTLRQFTRRTPRG